MASDNKTSTQTNSLVRYFAETRGELRKVTWPTREDSIRLTGIVLAVSFAFAVFLWGFDFIFSNAIQSVIGLILGF